MKKTIYRIFAAAAALAGAVSCNHFLDQGPTPIYPFPVYIQVQDSQDRNLMDTTKCDFFKTHEITATFREKTYKLGEFPEQTKATEIVKSEIYGLHIIDYYGLFQYFGWLLYFGDLPGDIDYLNEDLVIDWGDGTQDVITLYNQLGLDDDGNLEVKDRYVLLNGEKQTYMPLTIKMPYIYENASPLE